MVAVTVTTCRRPTNPETRAALDSVAMATVKIMRTLDGVVDGVLADLRDAGYDIPKASVKECDIKDALWKRLGFLIPDV